MIKIVPFGPLSGSSMPSFKTPNSKAGDKSRDVWNAFYSQKYFFLLLFGTGIIFWVGPSLLMIGVQEFGNDFLSRNDFWTGLSWKAMEKTAGVPEKNIKKKLELFLKNEKKKKTSPKVRCRELNIFKILEIFWEIVCEDFFGRNFFAGCFGRNYLVEIK